jgi:hypothetical protein
LETGFTHLIHKVFHPSKMVRKMKKNEKKKRVVTQKRAVMLVIGVVSAVAVIGAAGRAAGWFQGNPEKLEVRSADGNLLLFRQGKLIDNISIPDFPKTSGVTFVRGRGGEGAAVGMPPLVPNVGMTIKTIPGGVRINLDVPTLKAVEQMENEDRIAVEETIGIIENQKGISIEEVRAHVMRSLENMEKIDGVELWISYVENGKTNFAHAVVNWDSKEITSFENINQSGIVSLPPEVTTGMEKLNEMRSIALHDNRIVNITGGQRYIILPGSVTESEGELIFRMETSSYRVIVDLENKQVKSIEELGT